MAICHSHADHVVVDRHLHPDFLFRGVPFPRHYFVAEYPLEGAKVSLDPDPHVVSRGCSPQSPVGSLFLHRHVPQSLFGLWCNFVHAAQLFVDRHFSHGGTFPVVLRLARRRRSGIRFIGLGRAGLALDRAGLALPCHLLVWHGVRRGVDPDGHDQADPRLIGDLVRLGCVDGPVVRRNGPLGKRHAGVRAHVPNRPVQQAIERGGRLADRLVGHHHEQDLFGVRVDGDRYLVACVAAVAVRDLPVLGARCAL